MTILIHAHMNTITWHKADNTQQNSLHSLEENTSSFTDDNVTPCYFSITDHHLVTENANDTNIPCVPKQSGIHLQ